MKATKELFQTWANSRLFRRQSFPSLAGELYVTSIYWGGSMERPNMDCTCPKFVFQGRWCSHCEEMWGELDAFAKQHVIRHDEIAAKPWYRKSS